MMQISTCPACQQHEQKFFILVDYSTVSYSSQVLIEQSEEPFMNRATENHVTVLTVCDAV